MCFIFIIIIITLKVLKTTSQFSLIIKIEESNFNLIYDLLVEYGKEVRKDDNPDTTINNYKEFVNDSHHDLYYYSDYENNRGMSLVNLSEEMMYNFYMKKPHNSIESEIVFFDWIYNYLISKTGGFISQYPLFSDVIIDHITKLGLQGLIRHNMKIDRSDIEDLEEPELHDNFKFSPWNDKYLDECAKLTVEAYAGTLDSQIHVFFQQLEGSKEFFKNVSSGMYGNFDDKIECVLIEQNEVIGVCSIITNDNQGFIPNIIVSPQKRGLGLGKVLLIHTMKNICQKYDIESVGLAVTERNQNAFQLYKKLGFKSVNTGITYLKFD